MEAEYDELMKYLEDSGYVDLCITEDGYFDLEHHYLSVYRSDVSRFPERGGENG